MKNDVSAVKYDSLNDRLVFLKEGATNTFWENHWQSMFNWNQYYRKRLFSRTVFVTKKYLPLQSVILEGDCGLGYELYQLKKAGFGVLGIDYAKNTLKMVKQKLPEFTLAAGDLTILPLKNNSLDGYWSFGVIEHFYEGYSDLQMEAFRVLKTGGYFFLVFPAISRLRRSLINNNRFEPFNERTMPEEFYQFALNPEIVVSGLSAAGFRIHSKSFFGSLKGIKDSFGGKNRFLQSFYSSSNKLMKIAKLFIEITLGPLCGHAALIVAQQK